MLKRLWDAHVAAAAEGSGGTRNVCPRSCNGEACRCNKSSEVEGEPGVILRFIIKGRRFEPSLLMPIFVELVYLFKWRLWGDQLLAGKTTPPVSQMLFIYLNGGCGATSY